MMCVCVREKEKARRDSKKENKRDMEKQCMCVCSYVCLKICCDKTGLCGSVRWQWRHMNLC